MSAGEIGIKVEPRQLDRRGAVFAITLDTHPVELTSDLTADAQLEVGGTVRPVAASDGDGPGGQHREGTPEFDAAGPATGTARLTLGGFGEPVEATSELGP